MGQRSQSIALLTYPKTSLKGRTISDGTHEAQFTFTMGIARPITKFRSVMILPTIREAPDKKRALGAGGEITIQTMDD